MQPKEMPTSDLMCGRVWCNGTEKPAAVTHCGSFIFVYETAVLQTRSNKTDGGDGGQRGAKDRARNVFSAKLVHIALMVVEIMKNKSKSYICRLNTSETCIYCSNCNIGMCKL